MNLATFTATASNPGSPGLITPSGTVTFVDFTYQDLTPITTTLAADVPLDANGQASVTTSSLAAGNGFLGNHLITATYNGDANFRGGNAVLSKKVHAFATTTALTSSPNPSAIGHAALIYYLAIRHCPPVHGHVHEVVNLPGPGSLE